MRKIYIFYQFLRKVAQKFIFSPYKITLVPELELSKLYKACLIYVYLQARQQVVRTCYS